MSVKSIGIFAFGTSPIEHMAPLKTRALLGEAALHGVELLFFSTDDCDLAAAEIEATFWSLTGWAKRRTGLPALVLVITDPIRPLHQAVGAWLRGNARIIAAHAPDKLALSRFLLGTPLAGHVIPCTSLGSEDLEATLTNWASEHGAAIVKPVDGMRGGNIHFVGRNGGEDWMAAVGDERVDGTLAEAVAWIATRIAGRMSYRRYLVQRYVRSTTVEGRPAALRVDVQKGADGAWGIVRAVARFGEVGRFITNMYRGGYHGPPDGFLARRPFRPAAEMKAEFVSLSLKTAELLERSGEASIFELGVDIAIDPEDRLWIIEANARPDNLGTELPRAIRLIDYLRALSD